MNYGEEIRDLTNKMEKLLNMAKTENRDLSEVEQTVFDDFSSRARKLTNEVSVLNLRKGLETPSENISRVSVGTRNAEFGHFLQNVRSFRRGEKFDSQVLNATGMSVSVSADGGFAVEAGIADNLMQLVNTKSKLLPFVSQQPTQADKGGISIPAIAETSRADGSRFGGVEAFWIGEGIEGKYSAPKLRAVDLKLSKLLAFCAATSELMQDAPGLASWISDLYSSEIAFKVDDAILQADGLGKPIGILNSGALIEVPKESGQGADTIVFENLCKMWSRVSVRNLKNLVWIINRECLPELMTMTSPGIAPKPVYLPPEGASAAPYGTIFGRPVLEVESASKLGDAGDITLADMSDYIWTDKNGIQNDVSIHVQFLTDEECYRFRYRANGCPYTKAPVASKSNSNFSTSPYVTLAQR